MERIKASKFSFRQRLRFLFGKDLVSIGHDEIVRSALDILRKRIEFNLAEPYKTGDSVNISKPPRYMGRTPPEREKQ